MNSESSIAVARRLPTSVAQGVRGARGRSISGRMPRRSWNLTSKSRRGHLVVPLLLAAAVLLAACQAGGGGSAGNPADYPTTVNAPVEQDLSSCPTPPAFAPGPAGPADWPPYHRANDRHGGRAGSPAARGLNPLSAVRL